MKRIAKIFVVALTLAMTVTEVMAAGVSTFTAENVSDAQYEYNAQDSTQNRQQNAVLKVVVVENEIRVSDVPDGATLYIYSITGARIGSYTVHENKAVMDRSLAKGIYIIRVNNRAAKITIR